MNTNDMSMTDGEPDTSRGVSPVPREGVGDLPPEGGKAPLPYPTTGIQYFSVDSMQTCVHLYLASQLARSCNPLVNVEKRDCLYSVRPFMSVIPMQA